MSNICNVLHKFSRGVSSQEGYIIRCTNGEESETRLIKKVCVSLSIFLYKKLDENNGQFQKRSSKVPSLKSIDITYIFWIKVRTV